MSWNEIKKKHNEYIETLSMVKQAAIKDYINKGISSNKLILEKLEMDKNYINNLDNCIKNAPEIKIPFSVYRGINGNCELQEVFLKNKKLYHPQYMSTSINKKVAFDNFAGEDCCIFAIRVDDPTVKCLWISGKGSSESEVLFQRNACLNYKSHNIENGKTIFNVDVSFSLIENISNPIKLDRSCVEITQETVEELLASCKDFESLNNLQNNSQNSIDKYTKNITEELIMSYQNKIKMTPSLKNSIKLQVKFHLNNMYDKNKNLFGGNKKKNLKYVKNKKI